MAARKHDLAGNGALPRTTWVASYNSNSSMLRCDFFPSQYLTRNPYLDSPAGVNIAVASNATHPARVNPGVNRGYTADTDAHGKAVQRVTASCGPAIYRGDKFPAEYQGNMRLSASRRGISFRGRSS